MLTQAFSMPASLPINFVDLENKENSMPADIRGGGLRRSVSFYTQICGAKRSEPVNSYCSFDDIECSPVDSQPAKRRKSLYDDDNKENDNNSFTCFTKPMPATKRKSRGTPGSVTHSSKRLLRVQSDFELCSHSNNNNTSENLIGDMTTEFSLPHNWVNGCRGIDAETVWNLLNISLSLISHSYVRLFRWAMF